MRNIFLALCLILLSAVGAQAQGEKQAYGYGTAAQLSALVYANGILAVATDTYQVKQGNGATAFSALPAITSKRNLAATTDPGTADSSASGYGVGSVWVNTATDHVFMCVDASAGAAVWVQVDGGGGAAGAFMADASVGMTIDPTPDSVTVSWTPTAADGYMLRATATSCGPLVVSPPSGSIATGEAYRKLDIVNSCGGSLPVSFTGYGPASNVLTGAVIPNGEGANFAVSTRDSGTTWSLDFGYIDISTLPDVAPVGSDKAICQDTSVTPHVWIQCDLSEIAALAPAVARAPVAESGTSRTNTAADNSQWIQWSNASAKTFTIDGNVAAATNEWVGTNYGAADLTIVAGTSMTFQPAAQLVFGQGETYSVYFPTATTAIVVGGGT